MKKTEYDQHADLDLKDIVKFKKFKPDRVIESETTVSEIAGLVSKNTLEDLATQSYIEEIIAPDYESGEFELTDQPEEGDFITIGGETYTFFEEPDAPEEGEPEVPEGIIIGEALADTQENLVAYINEKSELVEFGEFALNKSTVTALMKGDLAIPVFAQFENKVGSFDAETLEGGVNGTEAKQGQIFFTDDAVYFAIKDCTPHEGNFEKIEFDK